MKTGREQLDDLFPRHTAPTMPDKAKQWVDLWRNNAPPAVRDLPQRHSESGGEYQFAKELLGRHWRFDWCIIDACGHPVKVAVEIDGGVWIQGRHSYGAGFEGDCEKLNAAAALGWRVFRFTPGMLKRDPYGCVQMVAGVVVTAMEVGE